MLKLIINADDFGMTENINCGIKQAHLNGIVTAASIMANGEAFEDAVKISKDLPNLDVGVHLTIIDGIPLLPSSRIKTLLDSRGQFYKGAWEFPLSKIDLKEVYAELKAQVEKVKARGVPISHFDGHMHMHIFPAILTVVVNLAKEFNIPFIRCPFESTGWGSFFKKPSRFLQLQALNFFSSKGRKQIAMSADHFTGFLFGGCLNKINLQKTISHLPKDGTCELMCHPGLQNMKIYKRKDELDALCDADIKRTIEANRIRVCSFRELAREQKGV